MDASPLRYLILLIKIPNIINKKESVNNLSTVDRALMKITKSFSIRVPVSYILIYKKLDEEMLYIRELQVNEGPTMKRVWPRARGRADRLLKRTCHISVVLDEIH